MIATEQLSTPVATESGTRAAKGQDHSAGVERSCRNCRHSRPLAGGGAYCTQGRVIGTAPKCRNYQEER